MILYSDFGEFYSDVGLLGHIDEFEGLRIRPRRLLGSFSEDRLPELITFCENNSGFHGEIGCNYRTLHLLFI